MTVAPRLHVIPAAGCDKALILRRGPASQVASLLWDRRTGRLDLGQWLKGRIYEHRCDLSPDARHMVIFARRDDASRAWSAVSRAPWLRAVAFWPQSSTWMGGGAFDAAGRLWLNGGWPEAEALPDGLVWADPEAFPHGTDGFHMGDLYPAMMALRGWHRVAGSAYDSVLTKPLEGGWHLELRFRLGDKNRGLISNAYALVNDSGSDRRDQPEWEWAERFGAGLQFARNGALYGAGLSPQGTLLDTRLVADLSDMTFEALAAPYSGVTQP